MHKRTWADLAGRADPVGLRPARSALYHRHIHPRRRIQRYMPTGVRNIPATARIKAGLLVHALSGFSTGWKKFMPKKPAANEIGMNNVVMTVSVLIMSFIRLLMTDRYVSSAPPTRSRRLSLMSYSRTR